MTLSLGTRLLVATLLVAALGLAATGAATYVSLRAFLFDRIDEQLDLAAESAHADLRSGRDLPRDERFAYPHGTYAELRDGAGRVLGSFSATSGPPEAVAVSVPAQLIEEHDRSVGRATVVGPGGPYRALTTRVPEGALVVAVPLADTTATLGRLLAVGATVAGAVLVVLALVARWAICIGLRPLEEIATTAAVIAAGDLSRRVRRDDPGTEVGRLGAAINQMLGQIEAAFAGRAASEQRLRRFVADASHELRTPLTSIRGYAELFRRGAAERPADLTRGMRRIEEESSRMGLLLDDLLELARLDQGRPLQRAPVDLATVAADAVADARAAAPDRPIDLTATRPLVVTGDDARLRQVAANLLANTRVHTPSGTPVRVGVAREGSWAVLKVADEGPGMAPDAASRVFERFYRADASRTRASGGSGLGLSIVAAIAAAHGGRVSVSSAPGAGAAFRVELPLDGGSS